MRLPKVSQARHQPSRATRPLQRRPQRGFGNLGWRGTSNQLVGIIGNKLFCRRSTENSRTCCVGSKLISSFRSPFPLARAIKILLTVSRNTSIFSIPKLGCANTFLQVHHEK